MKITKPLTDTDCRALKRGSNGKRTRAFDGNGLYLECLPSGRKVWRFRYGKKKRVASFGDYPGVTLAAARRMRDEAAGMVAHGLDVKEELARQEAADTVKAESGSFGAVSAVWFAEEIEPLSESYRTRLRALLARDILPYLARRPLEEITPPELLDVFKRIKARGAEETARRARVHVGQVFRYAIRNGIARQDPTLALKGERRTKPPKHFAAFTEPSDVARLMRAIYAYKGTPEVRALVKLSALLFQRPGEIRRMQWQELDFDLSQWRYVVNKTARHTQQTHIVPLSSQAVTILRDLEPLTNHPSELRPDLPNFVFPSPKTRTRPASENAVRQALRNMGFTNDEMTAHGFRAMARSLLSERGWTIDAIERQLSHKAAGPLGSAYDRAQFLAERQAMMQSWADYLDELRHDTGKVTPIGKARA